MHPATPPTYPAQTQPTTPPTSLPSSQIAETTQASSTQLTSSHSPFSSTLSSTTSHFTSFQETSQIQSTQFLPSNLFSFFPSSYTPTTVPSSHGTSSPLLPSSSLLSTTLQHSFSSSPPSSTLNSLSSCFYQVSNCNLCPFEAPLFDLTQGNVSCDFSQQGYWTWSFTPNSGTLTNTGEILLSGNTTTFVVGNLKNNASLNVSSESVIVIEGNFTQSSGGQIVFTLGSSSQQQNNSNSAPLKVNGCVSVNGNISLNLETQPQQGTTNLQVISYNCSQQVSVLSSQIQVTPNYNGSSCDTINSQSINQPNSLGISLTSTIGNKCNGGKNIGLIVGLSIGIPILAATVVTLLLVYFRKKEERKAIETVREMEMNNLSMSLPKPSGEIPFNQGEQGI